MAQGRNWCFTDFELSNYEKFKTLVGDKVRFIVFQCEIAPETKREHIQGYLQLTRSQRLIWLKKNISITAHWIQAIGNVEQNINYCSKEPKTLPTLRFGEPNKQGNRSDLEAVADMVKEKKKIVEIATEHPTTFIKYHRGINALKYALIPERNFKTNVWIIYGKPGVGKSKFVHDLCKDKLYSKPPEHYWWDGYNGEENVLIDEYRGQFEYEYLMRLLDRYPMIVQTKGSTVNFCSKNIFLTSEHHPDTWYPMRLNNYSLARRINVYMNLNDNFIYTKLD